MKWALDIDGTIDANPQFFAWLTYRLKKPGNTNEVVVITCRNPKRWSGTIAELQSWGILYDSVIMMPAEHPRDHKALLEWKLERLKLVEPDIWMDDEIKLYKDIYQIDVRKELPNCECVQM